MHQELIVALVARCRHVAIALTQQAHLKALLATAQSDLHMRQVPLIVDTSRRHFCDSLPMLQRIHEQRSAIESLKDSIAMYQLTLENWAELAQLLSIVEPLSFALGEMEVPHRCSIARAFLSISVALIAIKTAIDVPRLFGLGELHDYLKQYCIGQSRRELGCALIVDPTLARFRQLLLGSNLQSTCESLKQQLYQADASWTTSASNSNSDRKSSANQATASSASPTRLDNYQPLPPLQSLLPTLSSQRNISHHCHTSTSDQIDSSLTAQDNDNSCDNDSEHDDDDGNDDDDDVDDDDLLHPPKRFKALEQHQRASLIRQQFGELERYLVVTDITPIDDACAWWAGHQSDYPKLAVVARRYIGIPATAFGGLGLADNEQLLGASLTLVRDSLSMHQLCQYLFLAKNAFLFDSALV
jgi:hypothetical protein